MLRDMRDDILGIATQPQEVCRNPHGVFVIHQNRKLHKAPAVKVLFFGIRLRNSLNWLSFLLLQEVRCALVGFASYTPHGTLCNAFGLALVLNSRIYNRYSLP